MPIIFSAHPRTQKRIDEKKISFNSNVRLIKPVGFIDYVKLQMNANVVFSDSGTITEESSILNFPALNIRETHERHEGMEEASVMMVELDSKKIRKAIKILNTQRESEKPIINIVKDYDLSNVSEKILRIIHSYVDYINKKIWKKY